MTYEKIFEALYTLYRAEAQTPDSTDEEYTICMRLCNEAISRWANYDGVYWRELFTNLSDSAQSTPALVTTLSTGVSTYDCPTNMREAGGLIKVLGTNGQVQTTYKILNVEEVQFMSLTAKFAYFTGNPSSGYKLHLNPAPDASLNGLSFDYVYYKKPTIFTGASDMTEVADPYFIVHRALAQRLRISRNYPAYQTAMRDAEEALKVMQLDNNSGTWANPWTLTDRSGVVIGKPEGGFFA
jgi:hypothetical protein